MNEVMTGITFDISRKSTGWVKWEDQEPVETGVITLPAGYLGQQGSLFRNRLAHVLPERLDWVGFEDARAVSKQHGMILFGLTMILHEMCWNKGVPVLGFAQTTIKKALTGHGRASKEDMLEAAREKYPLLQFDVDDQADALAVGVAFWASQVRTQVRAQAQDRTKPRAEAD